MARLVAVIPAGMVPRREVRGNVTMSDRSVAGTTTSTGSGRGAWTAELRTTLRLAGPLIVVQLGQVGMNTVDTVMVGPLGPDSLAAAGVASAVYILVTLVCTGTIIGMTPLVSQAFGRGDTERCDQILGQGLLLAVLLSLPVAWLFGYGEPILRWLGQTPVVAELGGAYLGALAWSVTPFLLFMAFRQYLEGTSVTRPSMVITLFGLGVNVIANRAFIYGVDGVIPAMGVEGTGWATTVVRWSMLVAMIGYYVARHTERGRRLSWLRLRPDRAILAAVVTVGIPVGIQLGLEVGIFSLAAVMMGWFGAVELAAHQITINIATTTFMVAMGTSMAGSIRVGQHLGAERVEAVRHAVAATFVVAVGFMACCGLAFVVAPAALIGIYSQDPGVIAVGSHLLLFAAIFQIFDGAQVAGNSVLRGAADTRVPMLVSVLGYWIVALPIAYVLGIREGLGATGVWTGLAIGLAVVAVLLSLRVWQVLWSGTPAVQMAITKPARPEPDAAA